MSNVFQEIDESCRINYSEKRNISGAACTEHCVKSYAVKMYFILIVRADTFIYKLFELFKAMSHHHGKSPAIESLKRPLTCSYGGSAAIKADECSTLLGDPDVGE